MSNARDRLAGARRCEICGEAARVRVLRGYVHGEPLYQQFCMECADAAARSPAPRAGASHGHLRGPALLIVVGAVVAAFGALGDQVGASGSSGFGVYQLTGVLVAGACVVVGSLLAIDPLAAFGMLLLAVAAGADLLGLGAGDGWFGWKQAAAIVAGLAVCVAGFIWRWQGRRTTSGGTARLGV